MLKITIPVPVGDHTFTSGDISLAIMFIIVNYYLITYIYKVSTNYLHKIKNNVEEVKHKYNYIEDLLINLNNNLYYMNKPTEIPLFSFYKNYYIITILLFYIYILYKFFYKNTNIFTNNIPMENLSQRKTFVPMGSNIDNILDNNNQDNIQVDIQYDCLLPYKNKIIDYLKNNITKIINDVLTNNNLKTDIVPTKNNSESTNSPLESVIKDNNIYCSGISTNIPVEQLLNNNDVFKGGINTILNTLFPNNNNTKENIKSDTDINNNNDSDNKKVGIDNVINENIRNISNTLTKKLETFVSEKLKEFDNESDKKDDLSQYLNTNK